VIYAKRVKSPLKGGVDVKLGPKTVLVGPNGAGKTAIVQALKLGTIGYVDDQEGRDHVSSTAAIARLFPAGSELISEVDMSDGGHFSWSSKPRGKGYTKPKPKCPYGIKFPFQSIKALLSGDDKKIRTWLEERVGSSVTEEELVAMLPRTQWEEAKRILARHPERSPVELANALKAEARNLRAAATRKEKTVEGLVEGIPLPLSDAEATRLRGAKETLWAQATRPGITTPQQQASLRASIVSLVDRLSATAERIQGLPGAQEGEAETLKLAASAAQLSKAHLVQLGHDVCYVCLRKDADIQAAFDKWSGVLGQLEGAASRSRLEVQYATGKAEAERLAARFKGSEVVDSTAVLEEHGLIAEKLATHAANKQVWQKSEAARKEVAGSRSEADTYTSLARTWEGEGQSLLVRRKKEFEDKVTKWLPEGESFGVDLAAGRVGIVRGEAIHTSLSGAEMSRVLLAVLSALGEGGSTPSILEPEDRGWDPDTLASMMAALTDSPDQVILMSTVLPEEVEGWTVVQVGD
jgi:hypothetical protein